MSKRDYLKRIKAALLAGTMSLSLSSCGKSEEKQDNKTTDTTITLENPVNETTTKEIKTEIKTEEKKLETTKENNKEPSQYTTETQILTTNNINQTTEPPTTQEITQPIVTTTSKTSEKTIKTTTQVVTQIPVTTKQQTTEKRIQTTTQEITQPIVTTPQTTDYNISVENITKSADVFNSLADSMCLEIQGGARIQIRDCNGKDYWMYGEKEARVALMLLNMNETYENGVLEEVFNGYSDYEIKNGILYLFRIASIEKVKKIEIDFNDYTKDKNAAEYMNKLKKAANIAQTTGNLDALNKVLKSYIDGECNNYAAGLLTIGYGSEIEGNEYRLQFRGMASSIFESYGYGNQYQNKISALIH